MCIEALAFPLAFIFLGVAAIERYHWVVYIFAVVLLWGAFRVYREDPAKKTDSKAARWLSRHLPVTRELHQNAFFVKDHGRTDSPRCWGLPVQSWLFPTGSTSLQNRKV